MAKEKKASVPVRVERLLEKMRAGRVLCLTMDNVSSDENQRYWLEPGGLPVGNWTATRAMDLGLLEPVGDGLFAGATSQSYRLAH